MKINVHHIAKLANLTISAEEELKFQTQLSQVLTYVEKLQQVDTKGIEPTNQVTGLENVLRVDKEAKSLSQKESLSSSPSKDGTMFQVKGVFETE